MTVNVAPALPPAKPETSRGLTYLHGKLGCSPDDRGLVLTMADFGTAYMLEGWARRFVVELFRDYYVVFIGYRVEDPTMRGLQLSPLYTLPAREMCKEGSTEALAWDAFHDDKIDEALDILENPRRGGYEPKNVRERVHYHLTTSKIKTLEKHLILARLADLDKDSGRLVTTNFDHLFEKAQTKLRKLERSSREMTVNVAPALPPAKPETSRGLTYLHGKLGCSPDDRGLVLTMADFGTAYMLEGWAFSNKWSRIVDGWSPRTSTTYLKKRKQNYGS